jgi:hypothetical protein
MANFARGIKTGRTIHQRFGRVAAILGGIRFDDATTLKQRDLVAACREAIRASLDRFWRKLGIAIE